MTKPIVIGSAALVAGDAMTQTAKTAADIAVARQVLSRELLPKGIRLPPLFICRNTAIISYLLLPTKPVALLKIGSQGSGSSPRAEVRV